VTLGPHLGRLVSIGSAALATGPVAGLPKGRLGDDLAELLVRRNGFVAFESALVVRGVGAAPGDLADWNAERGWRASYSGMADDIFFFAEDIFGGQFGLLAEVVVAFDPETGDRRVLASSLEDWAEQILADFELMTGYPLGQAWQQRNGKLSLGKRLIPKIPFVLGGDFTIENLYALDSVVGMQVRGELAVQIRDLPDGARVSYRVVD
jgi:hypothetical protein